MREILTRLALAAAITFAAFAISAHAQQSGSQQPDEDRTPVSPRQQQPQATPKSPTQSEIPNTPERTASAESKDEQTQEALAFTGRLEEENGTLVLHDPVTKLRYRLDDPSKAQPYLGKQVKIVGKLAMRSNTIHIDSVELVP